MNRRQVGIPPQLEIDVLADHAAHRAGDELGGGTGIVELARAAFTMLLVMARGGDGLPGQTREWPARLLLLEAGGHALQ